MTKNCVKQVLKLQETCEDFNDLTVEQLLYAAIAGSDLEEVILCLKHTDWSKWIPGEKYKGPKENQRIQKIVNLFKSGKETEIDFQETDFGYRMRRILATI